MKGLIPVTAILNTYRFMRREVEVPCDVYYPQPCDFPEWFNHMVSTGYLEIHRDCIKTRRGTPWNRFINGVCNYATDGDYIVRDEYGWVYLCSKEDMIKEECSHVKTLNDPE